MNSLFEIKESFLQGLIEKHTYIKKMHNFHKKLFEYKEFIKSTNISKIEINDDDVTMTLRDNGIKILCDEEDKRIVPLEILNFGNYEESETNMAIRLIQKGFTILDIGANIGWFSLTLSKIKPDINIFAFEPIPKTFGYLKKNILLNKTENVKALNFGLSDKNGELTFYYYPETSGNASLKNVSRHRKPQKIVCKVKKLDDFIKENNVKIDFIKCDVEGAEFFVLKGGLNTIKRDQPILFLEMLRKWSIPFNYHPNDIINLLTNVGYQCYTIDGKRLKKFSKITEKTINTNFIFIHKNSSLTL